MTALEAALKVLQEARCALHYREIAKRVLDAGLWSSDGRTPEATISARLTADLKKKGKASAFMRTGRGMFAVNAARAIAKDLGAGFRSEEPVIYIPWTGGSTTVSFTDAAEIVLGGSGGRTMHYREITRHALENRMLDTSGRTPEATMYAQILTEVKRRQGRGEQQRFVVLGKGMVMLARSPDKGLTHEIDEANRKARKELLKRINDMTPGDFEDLVGRLLAAIGFQEVEVTARSRDGGIDVRGTLVVGDVVRTRLAVQVKRWKHNVQTPVVQQVRGSLGAHEQGLVITTSDFSKGARAEAERPDAVPVALMNGEQLVAQLVEYEIGVRRTTLQLIELGERLEAPDEE